MLLAVALAAALDAAAPTPAPSGSPASGHIARPLRIVAYDVVTNWRSDDITEMYAFASNAHAPGSSAFKNRHGTITIVVMGRTADGSLSITESEDWTDESKLGATNAVVSPIGIIGFDPTLPLPRQYILAELLPYFGTKFAPDGALDTTTAWTTESKQPGSTISTRYAVTSTSGIDVTVHKSENIKSIGTVAVDGSTLYEPSMLMPLSGNVTRRETAMYADGQTATTLNISFKLLSDSFRQTPP